MFSFRRFHTRSLMPVYWSLRSMDKNVLFYIFITIIIYSNVFFFCLLLERKLQQIKVLFYRYQVSYVQTIQWLMKISYDEMVNFLQDVVSSNSFCNHNCEWVSRFMHIESRRRQRWLTMIPSFKLWHDVKLWIAQLYIYFPKDVIWRVVKSSSRVKRVKGQLWPKLRKVRIWFQFDEGR